MEITGKIIAVLPIKSGTSKNDNQWQSQEYVIETVEQYPKRVCFEVFGADKIQSLAIKQGEELTINFDIDAREHNGRWFNSIKCWKAYRKQVQQPAVPYGQPYQPQPFPQPQPNGYPTQQPAPRSAASEQSDLPF